jgi:hypothetical protein
MFICGQAVIEHIALECISKLPDNMTFADIASKIIGVKHHAFLPEMKARFATRHAALTIMDRHKDAVIEREFHMRHMSDKLVLKQELEHSWIMLKRLLLSLSVLVFVMSLLEICAAHDLPTCPLGQSRQIKERVIEPASFTDVYSDRVVVYENNELLTIPAEWDWIDKPKGYVRPEYIEVEEVFVTSFGWASSEVEITFQHESHDILKKLDGTTERKIIPAITKKVQRRFQEHPVVYYTQKTMLLFDSDSMETPTKTRVQTKPSLTIQRDVQLLPKYVTDRFDITHTPIPPVTKTLIEPNVVGRIRHPAIIEQHYAACE